MLPKNKMQNGVVEVIVKDNKARKLANPAPLGLVAFGVTTFLLMCYNVGLWSDFDSVIVGMAIIFGGVCQIVVGVLCFFSNNTFGVVTFTSYGCFWISLVLINILPQGFGVDAPSGLSLSFYFFIWGILTAFLFIATLAGDKIQVLQIVFFLLLLCFGILSLHSLVAHFGVIGLAGVIQVVLGIVGIILSLLALYLGGAHVINAQYQRDVFPLIIPVEFMKKKEPQEAAPEE